MSGLAPGASRKNSELVSKSRPLFQSPVLVLESFKAPAKGSGLLAELSELLAFSWSSSRVV